MSCLRCPMVTLAEMRPDLAEFDPAGAVLCLSHFRELVTARRMLAALRARDAARIYCGCGNEMFLSRPGVCERCRLGPLPVADFRLVPRPALRRVAEFAAAALAPSADMTQPVEAPILVSQPCPPDLLPSGVRTAMAKADAAGWDTGATIAIGPPPEGIRSVVFYAKHPNGTRLISRHEGDTAGAKMGFSQGYRHGFGQGIRSIGWRELVAALDTDGVIADPVLTPKETAALVEARRVVTAMMNGAQALEVIPTRPRCKGLAAPGLRCVRPAEADGVLCTGPCRVTW